MILRLISLAAVLLAFSAIRAEALISPEEHASHHPDQAGSRQNGSGAKGMGGPPEGVGGGPPQGAGGMMGGDMGGMMEKRGAPKPKDLHPSLMALHHLAKRVANNRSDGMNSVLRGKSERRSSLPAW